MGRTGATSRILATVSVGVVLALVSTHPASAAPKGGDDSDKITICHVTNSQRNPYVVIEIDASAFDDVGKRDHAHHVSKDGRVDFQIDSNSNVCEPPSPTGGDT